MRSPRESLDDLPTIRLRQIVDTEHKDVALLLRALSRRDAEIARLEEAVRE
jgi:hypothetical protein